MATSYGKVLKYFVRFINLDFRVLLAKKNMG